jgi:hypothetical protein
VSSSDLFCELDDAIIQAQSHAVRSWRERVGWPIKAVAMGLGGGVSKVITHPDGTYTPTEPNDPDGDTAIIAPIWDGPAPGHPEDIIDLAAWVPSFNQTFTRCGLADLLGEWAIWNCTCIPSTPNRLMVFSDILQWAKAAVWNGPGERGSQGIVILDAKRAYARLRVFVGSVEFMVADLGTGQRLRNGLLPPDHPRPKIFITSRPSEAAE